MHVQLLKTVADGDTFNLWLMPVRTHTHTHTHTHTQQTHYTHKWKSTYYKLTMTSVSHVSGRCCCTNHNVRSCSINHSDQSCCTHHKVRSKHPLFNRHSNSTQASDTTEHTSWKWILRVSDRMVYLRYTSCLRYTILVETLDICLVLRKIVTYQNNNKIYKRENRQKIHAKTIQHPPNPMLLWLIFTVLLPLKGGHCSC